MPTKNQVLDLIWNEPVRIGHWIGFKDLTKLHNDWLRGFLFSSEDQTLLAHRGSYKTSVLTLFLALHAVIEPNEPLMYFRKTDNDVAEVARQVTKILSSPLMAELTTALYGRPLRLRRSTDSEIQTDLTTSFRGVSQIVGLGINTSITGKHADVVVTDDIVNLKDRISRAERDRTKLQYMELQNIKNRGGRFINTGTPWHKEDAISLMPNVRTYDCYSTGLIGREKLNELRTVMTPSLFAANYELKHIADENAMFCEPHFTEDSAAIYGGVAHIDAAYGGADLTAFTIMRRTGNGIIGFGKLWERHVDDCLGEISALHQIYRAGSISCERNADKGYLAKELKKRGFSVREYQESTNKFVKISTYLRRDWDNILWLNDTDPEYINMILDYTEFAEHDDAPDSAASLLRILEKPTKVLVKGFKGGI